MAFLLLHNYTDFILGLNSKFNFTVFCLNIALFVKAKMRRIKWEKGSFLLVVEI